ncbi:hypothetical protein [Mobilicoccus pelagius]|uniref:Uncharacterized protein n=1 Tax=Mobilicoccus pelagius NBRC 104925 TaxID=1089455 RepID=H5UQU1_9MICO|nr:hypothetical protein [Mobilicoccus pelagius]GAB48099.1 hypothetical protein MOPEL_060_00150 [Mobilicoccus pelagius NBRC 104925]
MSNSTIQAEELHTALAGMTGAADVVEAVFTPWDDDQLDALTRLLSEMTGLERLDDAVSGETA